MNNSLSLIRPWFASDGHSNDDPEVQEKMRELDTSQRPFPIMARRQKLKASRRSTPVQSDRLRPPAPPPKRSLRPYKEWFEIAIPSMLQQGCDPPDQRLLGRLV